ncbi:MAG: MoxR-like ATPase [Saprospiraceae bacterium]|jgi:MoxR-like ATPase
MKEEEIEILLSKLSELKAAVHQVIIGQEVVLNHMIIGLLASGHVLLEGVPGLAKTLMIKTLAKAMDFSFKRIQFTPDLMPSDILGTEILQEDENGKRYFKFSKGPVFTNMLLADEINRTPPKTQSALLELMQEYSVTYAGQNYPLPKPFFLLATQNPIEQSGTFPLPEAQVDRFLLHIKVEYPSASEEIKILETTTGDIRTEVPIVFHTEEIIKLQQLCREVHIDPSLIAFVSRLVRSTRPQGSEVPMIRDYVDWGAGPRAGQALILAAKGHALLNKRYAVIPEDIRGMVGPTLRHRLILNFRSLSEEIDVLDIIDECMKFNKLK